MVISMDDSKWMSLDQIQAFLAGSGPVEFAAHGRAEVYGWVERTLVRHEYARLGKADKGLLRRYLEKMTGLSRAQVTRLIASYTATGRVRVTEYKRHRFAARYTKADVELLAYLETRAATQSDTEAALAMQEAKRELFRRIGRKVA